MSRSEPHSNRRVRLQMELWGWELHRSRSNVNEMKHPVSGTKVSINADGYHTVNSRDTMALIYGETCKGNVEQFWARRHAATLHEKMGLVEPSATLKPVSAFRRDKPGRAREVDVPMPVIPQSDSTGHVIEPTDEPTLAPGEVADGTKWYPAEKSSRKGSGAASPHRGASNEVLSALIAMNGRTLDVKTINAGLPKMEQKTISNACIYLVSLGLAERPKRGMYRASQSMLHADSRIDVRNMTINEVVEHVEKIKAEPAPAPEPPTTIDEDAMMDCILDAMMRHNDGRQWSIPFLARAIGLDVERYRDPMAYALDSLQTLGLVDHKDSEWKDGEPLYSLVQPTPAPAPAPAPMNESENITPDLGPLPVAVTVHVQPTDKLEASMMDALELMFPDGFKARHLAAVSEWREATIKLGQALAS